MKSFKEYISEQWNQPPLVLDILDAGLDVIKPAGKKIPIDGYGIEPGSIIVTRPRGKADPFSEIDGYYHTGEYDGWGNPIYSPEFGSGILNHQDGVDAIINDPNMKPWNPPLPQDVIDAIINDPGNMDEILDDYLSR